MTVLAVDLGASSGRVMAAHFDGERLVLDLPDGLREAVAERLEVEP